MLLNELGDELTTNPAPEIVREVKFRDEPTLVNERAKSGKNDDKKQPLSDIEKSLHEWYNKNNHKVSLKND